MAALAQKLEEQKATSAVDELIEEGIRLKPL